MVGAQLILGQSELMLGVVCVQGDAAKLYAKITTRRGSDSKWEQFGAVEIGTMVDREAGVVKLSRRSGDGQVGLGTHLWARLISEAVGSTPELRPCGVCIPLSFAVFTSF